VKANQKTLLGDIQECFEGLEEVITGHQGRVPAWLKTAWKEEGCRFSRFRDVSTGHGRTEIREAWAWSDPVINTHAGREGSVGKSWPGLAQIVRVRRERTVNGQTSEETVYLITSLSSQKADAQCLLSYNRAYWGIENRLHWVRDETFGEDRSQVRSGSAPQVMAALRNLTLTLLRRGGRTNIAAALRTFAGRPRSALSWVLSAHLLL
jgi:predicted transposase YbfD/YdcC